MKNRNMKSRRSDFFVSADAVDNAAAPICYHCAQPLTAAKNLTVMTASGEQSVCCAGCKAVVEMIGACGLDNYYRYRDSVSTDNNARDNNSTTVQLASIKIDDFAYLDQNDFLERSSTRLISGFRESELLIGGMHCAACVWLLQQRLQKLIGVKKIDIDFDGQRGTIEWDENATKLSAICAAIAGIGYRPEPYRRDREQQLREHEQRKMLRQLGVAGIGMMQVGMLALGLYAGAIDGIEPLYRNYLRWVSLLVTLPVLMYAGAPFFIGAWRSTRARQPGMDVPIALALLLAFIASTAATVQQNGDVYFDAITMFIFLLLGSRYLDLRARNYRHSCSAELLNLLPNAAVILEADGQQRIVPIDRLCAGDTVLVRSGETLPADGYLLDALATLNEAAISGEYLPITKTYGELLLAGTINGETPLTFEIAHTGAQLRIAAIQQLTRQAQQWKPRLAQLADRIASAFTVSIVVLAALTFFVWHRLDPQRALWVTLSILVVSCPCALSLATPMAITTATNALRRAGILVTRAEVWEKIDAITDVVFDKTGTLTEGRVVIADNVICRNGRSVDICRDIAAALESGSNHPIAQAFASRAVVPALERKIYIGFGVEGVIAGRRYRLGAAGFALALSNKTAESPTTGQWILLADGSGPLCWFRLQDQLRNDAASTILALQRRGLRVHLLSGDSSDSAIELATQLGIDCVERGASPERKLAYIAALQRDHQTMQRDNKTMQRRVMMIGDGINDIPVLAAADISMAMSNASQLAKTNADCIFLTSHLDRISMLFIGAKKTREIIRQNLAWALLYNAIAVPFAAAGWIAPWLAAIGMSLSSLLVTANALRLRRLSATIK